MRQTVSAREAAQQYGIEVNRSGMAVCPFHNDKNPSMKLDRRFHCFGCGADGDVIGFAQRLFDLPAREAARKLAADFGISFDEKQPVRRAPVKTRQRQQREEEQQTVGLLTDYLHLLKHWQTVYAPKTMEAPWDPHFVEAMQHRQQVEEALDLLLTETGEEKAAWISSHQAELKQLERRRDGQMSEKKTARERLKEITDSIADGITDLFESEKYRRYLTVMSRFHRYSVNNTMLIYMQKPDATQVAGYSKWADQFDRHVKKGEHGITIIAPTPYVKKVEQPKLDPKTQAPMTDGNGQVIKEEKEIRVPMFRPVKVFDISQTEGQPLPQLASTLTGNVEQFDVFLEALRRAAPVPMDLEPLDEKLDGYFSPAEQRIAIRSGMSQVQTVSAAIHEITHSMLHNSQKPEDRKSRNTQEVEAESVSYAVCQYYGIETAENSFGYIAGWSRDKTLPELRESLETINRTAGDLIAAIDGHFREICQEKNSSREPPAEPEQAAPESTGRYQVLPNEQSHNELDRSQVADRTDGTVLGAGRTKQCEQFVQALNTGKIEPEAVTQALTREAQRWHCYVIADLLTWNPQAMTEKPVARIDRLDSGGGVGESVLYTDPARFEADVKRETEAGEALSVVLFKDQDSQTVPHEFLFHLDPLPRGIRTEPAPSFHVGDRTPIELYDTYEEASARFRALRQQDYNGEYAVNPQSGQPSARLTFGVQREDPPGAADLLHVRNGQNYLVDDFTRMASLRSSVEVMDILHRMQEDLGFDRVIRHEKDGTGRYLPPADIPYEQWSNPYFSRQPQEKLYLIDDASYLHLQSCATGFDYTLYDAASGRLTDGGVLDTQDQSLEKARAEVCRIRDLEGKPVQEVGLETLKTLSDSFNALRPSDTLAQQEGWLYGDSSGSLPDNPLKNAEQQLEDDCNMIDGVINNGPKEPIRHWVQDNERRESVVLRLRQQIQKPSRQRTEQRTRGGER